MPDSQYQVLIGNDDFSDCIAMDGRYKWSVSSFSAQEETGQDEKGNFHLPILGERVQLAFTAPAVILQSRLYELAEALSMGAIGQRDVSITYDDPAFGDITQTFYCTNLPWIKRKLPDMKYYAGGVTWQLATTTFVNKSIADVGNYTNSNATFPPDNTYRFYISGIDFSDIVSINDGFKGQYIEQSLQSATGLTLDGKFHLPVIGGRSQIDITGIGAIEVPRFRQLCKALQFSTTGERKHSVQYYDMVKGQTMQTYYCTSISGERKKLPNAPFHYMQSVSFAMAMKQFFE